jgi:uncharacterized iron-regulated protein
MAIRRLAERTKRLCRFALTFFIGAHGLAGCVALAPPITEQPSLAIRPANVTLIGEQHDAPEHHALQRQMVADLTAQHRLAALLLEMADAGVGTENLPPTATEAQVQAALQWREAAWPWQNYGPSIMAAVRAQVPVLGANLPRAEMRTAMADTHWDEQVPPPVLQHHHMAIREGHCGLMPEAQIPAMARIQIARDVRMAQTIDKTVMRWGHEAARIAKPDVHADTAPTTPTVMLLAGSAHVVRSTGIPLHLAARYPQHSIEVIVMKAGSGATLPHTEADKIIETPVLPESDYCAQLRPVSRPATTHPPHATTAGPAQ